MVLQSAYWLALSYFTYFFSYGIYLPFFGVWLKAQGIAPDTIGILLAIGLIARFLGSLLIAPRVKDPTYLITALRLLALMALAFAIGFGFGTSWAWLLLVILGFNLFFAPLMPLSDALASTWQQQITLDYGRVRLWGSLAFVIGSALTGKLVSVWGAQAILFSLLLGLLVMLLGMSLKPSIMPKGKITTETASARSWQELLSEGPVWRFLLCVTLLQGAHAAYYGFASLYWQDAGYSAATIGYLWSLGVVAEIIIFASSKFLFRRWTIPNLLLLSALSGLLRWGLMAYSTDLSVLLLVQILHSGTFTVCHLAAMRFIATYQGAEVIRLQAVYSALATGGGIAIMTILAGFLFEYWQGGVFWVMAAVVLPTLFIRPQRVATHPGR